MALRSLDSNVTLSAAASRIENRNGRQAIAGHSPTNRTDHIGVALTMPSGLRAWSSPERRQHARVHCAPHDRDAAHPGADFENWTSSRYPSGKPRWSDGHGREATVATGGVYAPGQYPHGVVALSRRLSRRQFQFQPYRPLRPNFGTRQVRCVLHGRPSGSAQHADERPQAQCDHDVI